MIVYLHRLLYSNRLEIITWYLTFNQRNLKNLSTKKYRIDHDHDHDVAGINCVIS